MFINRDIQQKERSRWENLVIKIKAAAVGNLDE